MRLHFSYKVLFITAFAVITTLVFLGFILRAEAQTVNNLPIGNVDVVECSNMSIGGWTCDPDAFSQALDVHVYRDGAYGAGGVWVEGGKANIVREAAVGAMCGDNRAHGFSIQMPQALKDGTEHKYYAYAIDSNGVGPNPLLTGTYTSKNCPAPAVALAAPTGFTTYTSHSCGGRVTLAWSSVAGATSYEVSKDGLNWDDAGFSIMYTSYSGLPPSTSGSYYVRAKNAGGFVSPSTGPGEAVSSAACVNTPVPVAGVCGEAARGYSNANDQLEGPVCKTSVSPHTNPAFASGAAEVKWRCPGPNGGPETECTARRPDPAAAGSCGAAHNVPTASQPSSNLCSGGGALTWTDRSASDGGYNWSCGTEPCSATKNECGTAHNVPTASQPSSNLCVNGALAWDDGTGSDGAYNWRCGVAQCSATKSASVTGRCGTSHETNVTSPPASNLCSSGSVIWTDTNGGDGAFNWHCKGSGDGTASDNTTARCRAGNSTLHACGDANKVNTEQPPSNSSGNLNNLCKNGTLSWIDDKANDGTYNWSCGTVQCDATKTATKPNLTSYSAPWLVSGTLVKGTNVTFRGGVKNNGTINISTAFSDNFSYRWGTSGGWLEFSSHTQPSLNVNDARNDTSQSFSLANSGTLQIQHCVDSRMVNSYGQIDESDETAGDNCKIQQFTITELAGDACGYANGVPTATQPSSNLCLNGVTPSWIDDKANDGTYNWSCGTARCDATKSGATTYSCTGTLPSGATLDSGDNVGLTANTPFTYSGEDKAAKCQFSCNRSSTWNGSACVPYNACGTAHNVPTASQPSSNLCSGGSLSWIDDKANDGTYNWSCGPAQCDATKLGAGTYSCTGTLPANTTAYSGDDAGLTTNTARTHSAAGTSAKCEYSCNTGYTWNGSACVGTTEYIDPNMCTLRISIPNLFSAFFGMMMSMMPWSNPREPVVEGVVPTTPPTVYACTGTLPANATTFSGDDAGLTTNTARTHSAAGTSAKCEYSCNSGTTWSGSACISTVSDTANPSNQTLSIGSAVKTKSDLNIRATPSQSGTILNVVQEGARGQVVDGPRVSGDTTWWKVQYTNGILGWSMSTYLISDSTANPSNQTLSIGSAVKTLSDLNVRATPSLTGTILSVSHEGSSGRVVDGPRVSGDITWWKVQYTNGNLGWSMSTYLGE